MSDSGGFEVDPEDDPAAQLEADIAERLAVISDHVDTPDEFEQGGASFSPAEVDFSGTAWMQRLAEVQGWLRLGEELNLENPQAFVASLLQSLGLEDGEATVDSSTGVPRLSLKALGRLLERVDQAERVAQKFVEQLVESGSRKVASDLWRESWDEEPDIQDLEVLEPVSATTDVWPIYQFTHKKLNLTPSYQRSDVWTNSARQALIESILRGIPLPSVILLKSNVPGQPHEVVDGKQRLTAILRFVGKHPLAIERVALADEYHLQGGSLLGAFQEDYPRFKKMWKALQHESLTSKLEDEYFFPFRLGSNEAVFRGPLEPLMGKYFSQVTECVISVADEEMTVRDLFEAVVAYKIPVIEYKKATQAQIHEVFKLYNKQGVHLNAEEIRNAVYHELELTRATLVAAGDSALTSVSTLEDIAPSLVQIWDDIAHLGETLRSYGFGSSRYRRTKVLSWVLATLLGDTGGKDLPSTSRHIDDLLKKAQGAFDKPGAAWGFDNVKLQDSRVIASLLESVSAAIKLHAAYEDELWAPQFKDGGSGQKWQELQLIGSILGILIAYLADPETAEARVEEHAATIFSESSQADRGEAESLWARPKKTQTRTQWEYIAKVARRVAEILEADPAAVSIIVRSKFGSTGIESLLAMVPNEGR